MKDWADHRTTKQLWTWNTWTGNLTTMQLPYFNVLQQNTDKNWRNKKHGYDMGFKVKMFSWMSFQKLKHLLFPYKVNFHQRKVQQPRSYNTEYLPRVKQWTKPVFLLFLTNRKSTNFFLRFSVQKNSSRKRKFDLSRWHCLLKSWKG